MSSTREKMEAGTDPMLTEATSRPGRRRAPPRVLDLQHLDSLTNIHYHSPLFTERGDEMQMAAFLRGLFSRGGVSADRTVGDLISAYLSTLSEHSRRQAEWILGRWVLPEHGATPLGAFDPQSVEALHASIPYRSSADQVIKYLHAALRRGERWSWIERNPARFKGDYLHGERVRTRTLTVSERGLMWPWLESEERCGVEFRVLRAQGVQLLGLTGLRKSEIIRLPFASVRVDGKIISIDLPETKTGAKRCYLGPGAVELIGRIEPHHASGHLFPWKSTKALDECWRKLRSECGFEDATLHDLRRTFWTLIGDAGVDGHDAAAASGHSSLTVHRKHYRHVSATRVVAIMALGGAAMKGEGNASA